MKTSGRVIPYRTYRVKNVIIWVAKSLLGCCCGAGRLYFLLIHSRRADTRRVEANFIILPPPQTFRLICPRSSLSIVLPALNRYSHFFFCSTNNNLPASVSDALDHAKRAFALRKYEQAVEHYATALELLFVSLS
jgi:hypothetical protein